MVLCVSPDRSCLLREELGTVQHVWNVKGNNCKHLVMNVNKSLLFGPERGEWRWVGGMGRERTGTGEMAGERRMVLHCLPRIISNKKMRKRQETEPDSEPQKASGQ